MKHVKFKIVAVHLICPECGKYFVNTEGGITFDVRKHLRNIAVLKCPDCKEPSELNILDSWLEEDAKE